jgi:hypothetical protein
MPPCLTYLEKRRFTGSTRRMATEERPEPLPQKSRMPLLEKPSLEARTSEPHGAMCIEAVILDS